MSNILDIRSTRLIVRTQHVDEKKLASKLNPNIVLKLVQWQKMPYIKAVYA